MVRSLNGCLRTQSFCSFLLAISALCSVAATSDKNPATFSSTPKNTVNPQSALFNVSGIGYSTTQDTFISFGHVANKADTPACAAALAGRPNPASDSSRTRGAGVDTVHRIKDTCVAVAGVKKDALLNGRLPSLTSEPQKRRLSVEIQQEKSGPKTAFKIRGAVRPVILLLSITIIGMVVWFVRRTNKQPAFLSTTRLSVMDKEVQKTCRYIEKNYAKTDLSIDMICSDLVTGEAFLEALFEKELGLSIDQFITYVRINRARIFIENNLLANAETVGMETGFATTEMFIAAFNKIVGTSFEEYRKLRARRETVND